MALVLYLHPLASSCQKVLIALHESGTVFEPHFPIFPFAAAIPARFLAAAGEVG